MCDQLEARCKGNDVTATVEVCSWSIRPCCSAVATFQRRWAVGTFNPRDRSLVTGRCSQCWGGAAAGSSLALPHRTGLLLVPAGGLADPTVLVPDLAQPNSEVSCQGFLGFVFNRTHLLFGARCSNQKCSIVFLFHAKLMQCRSFKIMQKWVTVSG